MRDEKKTKTQLINELKELRQKIAELTKSNQVEEELSKVYDALNSSVNGVIITDLKGSISYVNDAFLRIFEYTSRNDVIGKNAADLFVTEEVKKFSDVSRIVDRINGETEEFSVQRQDGSVFPVEVSSSIVTDKEGDVVGRMASFVDISRRRRAEEQLKTALREKEVFLKEVYHRTKNNMAMIQSLLEFQSRHIEDKQVLEMFREIGGHVRVLAFVHEKLYRSQDLANIVLKEYFEDLVSALCRSYRVDMNRIFLRVDIDQVVVTTNIAITCGLILNELLTNIMKYAFPDGKGGEIRITLHATDEDEMEFRIRDNGIGLPENFNINNTSSLGLQLVTMLVEHHLKGTVEIKTQNGTEFLIRFKLQSKI